MATTNIEMNKPNITLATEGTYCENDIKVAAKLQKKAVAPTAAPQTVAADDGYAGLSDVTVGGAPTITDLDLSYGEQTLTYDTTTGMTVGGAGKVTYSDSSTADITKEIEIPFFANSGLTADATSDAKKVQIKIDPQHSVYMATTPTAANAVPVKTGNAWAGIPASPSATASSVVTRDAAGRAQFGVPVNDADAATKSYVDSAIEAEGPAGTVVALSAPTGAMQGTLTAEQLAALQASDNASIMLDHKKYYLNGKGHQEGFLTYSHVTFENNIHTLESITITISTLGWVLKTSDVYNMQKMTQAAYDTLETKDSNTLYLIVG